MAAARTRKAKVVEPATVAEVRAFFADAANAKHLPEGVESVGQRGRLSQAVKDAFTKATKRPVA